ncbi:MAG: hypothetical protein KDJ29_05605 [Hyphomicrobiales bacterium]|nr:hypothetical protein [Hyphomicrobiales bacterium]
MECFQHPGHPVIGICKHCGKAVCRDCARETIGGLACSAECEENTIATQAMMEAARRAYGIGVDRPGPPTGVLMPGLLGIGFLLVGLWDLAFRKGGGIAYFMLPMGMLFLFGAWYAWRKYKTHGINV